MRLGPTSIRPDTADRVGHRQAMEVVGTKDRTDESCYENKGRLGQLHVAEAARTGVYSSRPARQPL